MAVYSEIICDESILQSIPETANDVLIIACGGCMNESLAYKNEIPIFSVEKGETLPSASYSEAQRVARLLSEHGYNARAKMIHESMPVLCIYSEEYEFDFCDDSFTPNVVLALCCKAGLFGLRKRFSVPVIHIARNMGVISYTYTDLPDKRRIILKEKSTVILDRGKKR